MVVVVVKRGRYLTPCKYGGEIVREREMSGKICPRGNARMP